MDYITIIALMLLAEMVAVILTIVLHKGPIFEDEDDESEVEL